MLEWLNKNSGALTFLVGFLSSVPLVNSVVWLISRYKKDLSLKMALSYIGTEHTGIRVLEMQAYCRTKNPVHLTYFGMAIKRAGAYEKVFLNNHVNGGITDADRPLIITYLLDDVKQLLGSINPYTTLYLYSIQTNGKISVKKWGKLYTLISQMNSSASS